MDPQGEGQRRYWSGRERPHERIARQLGLGMTSVADLQQMARQTTGRNGLAAQLGKIT